MKTNIKLFTIGLAAAFGAGLMSCSDSETYDVRGANQNLVYVNRLVSNVCECNVYRTPVLTFGEIQASFPVKTQYRVEAPLKITAVVDTTLTGDYNKKNKRNAVSVPEDIVKNIVVTSTEIEEGATSAAENLQVSVPEEFMQNLTEEEYVLPLRLAYEGSEGERKLGVSEYGVYYIAIHNHFMDKLAKLSTSSQSATILKVPDGYSGNIDVNFNVNLEKTIKSDVSVNLVPSTKLVDAYNTEHGTQYPALPEKLVEAMKVTPAVITAGQTSGTVNVKSEGADYSLMKPTTYLLPLQMEATYANGEVNPNENDVAYAFITLEESNIEISPTTINGKTVSDISAWKCIKAVNFDPAKLSTTGWMPLEKKESGEFVVDFGAMHTITGFMKPYCRLAGGNPSIWFSTDGNEWTSPGSVNGKNTVKDANNNDCYVLSKAVKARYVKLKVYYNTGSYTWNYFGQSWANNYFLYKWNVVFND